MKALFSITVFAAAYALIASEKINKTIVAVLGASCVLLMKLVTFEQAIGAVDFNVIFLLIGMMTSVYVLSKTGFFEWIAISVAKRARGNPWVIMMLLLTVTAVLSAFLDNVTTIIMLVPVTILIMQLLEISPVPFVIMEAIVSNIGGTATLIGDPPNIIIGSQAGLSFNSFLYHLGPAVLIVFAFFIATVFLVFGKRFYVPEKIRERVIQAIPNLAIVDKKNMVKALWIFALMFAGFFMHSMLDIQPGVIALGGSMLMLLICRSDSEDSLMRVEWGVIFFFIGMFMMIAALEVNGVMEWVGNHIIHMAGSNLFLVCIVVLWGSAIFSSILDNIPFVITMIPIVRHFVIYFSQSSGMTDPVTIQTQIAHPLWWALALGACLGGNGTLIGASANIVMARISEKNGYRIGFKRFFKYGFAFMIQSMVICTVYIWLRYFHG
ncbi:MAG: ArsB/NhaD family transporter [Candidatus Omnitrophota bacterium]|nr:ArsB/NhaD family transporter [Candidatus Omnitrophota bacterium]